MDINQQKPLLSFEFASSENEISPLTFHNPVKVIIANTIDEVLPSFQLIQNAVKEGYYAAGFVSYESAPAFDSAYKVRDGHLLPLVWFGIFVGPEPLSLQSYDPYKLSKWTPSVTYEEYQESMKFIRTSIEHGDTYQTNYTIRLNAEFEGDDLALFGKLKRAQSSNYCAYINTGEHSILSASPELFFHKKGNHITTRPMKGTTKRGNTYDEDKDSAKWLFHSEKNRAENIMIVDLLRNDLNMIANPGTVQVEKLFDIEQYPTVLQMTSTITAKLPENTELIDVFKALFPCGSITGAPKISTMDIITKIETTPREVYCGAIGYITPHDEAVFNVPIRTVVMDQKTGLATYGVGGGITWDSTTKGEYDEILVKASILDEDRSEFQLLESLLLNEGEFLLLDEHLNRLGNSAGYFHFLFNLEDVKKSLLKFADENNQGNLKIRLLLNRNGKFTIEGQPIKPFSSPLNVALSDEPLSKNNPFLYHKTTNREIYSQIQAKYTEVFDVLLWNEDKELTEFTNGNVVLEFEEMFFTPPINSGLLAGTYREMLLRDGKIHEKKLTIDDLKQCKNIWFINSVREWVKVQLV